MKKNNLFFFPLLLLIGVNTFANSQIEAYYRDNNYDAAIANSEKQLNGSMSAVEKFYAALSYYKKV